MAIINITPPFDSRDHVSMSITLDDQTYRMDFKQNKQTNTWFMDLFDSLGAPLVLGMGLSAGIDILYPYKARQVPPGKLFVSPQFGAFVDPDLDAFEEGEAIIYYITEAEAFGT